MTDAIVVDFSEDRIPDEDTPAWLPSDSEFSCEKCGKPLTYSGRGRKPKYCDEHKGGRSSSAKRPTARANNDVEQAVQSVEGLYTLLSFALMPFAPQASALLTASIPGLSDKNRGFLANDKDLVRQINKVGKTGGRVAFFGAQAMVVAPVVMLAVGEIREKIEEGENDE